MNIIDKLLLFSELNTKCKLLSKSGEILEDYEERRIYGLTRQEQKWAQFCTTAAHRTCKLSGAVPTTAFSSRSCSDFLTFHH